MQKSDAQTLEHPHVQEEIHLRKVDFPLSYVSFRVRGGGGLGSLNYSLSGQGEETSSLNVAGNLEVFPENKSG